MLEKLLKQLIANAILSSSPDTILLQMAHRPFFNCVFAVDRKCHIATISHHKSYSLRKKIPRFSEIRRLKGNAKKYGTFAIKPPFEPKFAIYLFRMDKVMGGTLWYFRYSANAKMDLANVTIAVKPYREGLM